ncbi:MAG: substrate-binding domain-containing protein [Pseudacidovorax sp.]|nr:substrate-binding domain-containing protein [Pseudacidovorax sp.]
MGAKASAATGPGCQCAAGASCRHAGLRIPEDISITGVDNTDLGATQTPGLTSIRTPITEIGLAAATQLIARLDGDAAASSEAFPTEIVFRGSTASPPEGR